MCSNTNTYESYVVVFSLYVFVFVTNSSSLQKRVKIIMRDDDEKDDDETIKAKLKPKKKNKMLLHRVGSGLLDVATTTSGLTASAVSALRPKSRRCHRRARR